MLTKLLIFLFICAISTVFGQFLDPDKLQTSLEEFYNCPDFPDLKMSFSDIDIHNLNRSFRVLSAKLEVKEDISENVQGRYDLKFCDSEIQTDTCQHITTQEVAGLCESIDDDRKPLYPILNSIQNFDKRCPLKQGIYEVKDAHFDFKKWLPVVYINYIKVRLSLHDAEDNMVLCVNIEFDVQKKRRQ